MKCDYIDVLKKPGILPETVMGRVCFLTGVFLLESGPMVMDRCSFEQDRWEQFSYDVHRERYPVYVLWELCCRGVMSFCCGDCVGASGEFSASLGRTVKVLGLVGNWQILIFKIIDQYQE